MERTWDQRLGYPPERTWDKRLGYPQEKTWDQRPKEPGTVVPPPRVNKQTPVKT